MNLYLFVSVYALIDALEIQHVNIWTNNMDNNDGWIGYNNFNFTLELDKCVTGTCGYTTADNNGPSYIQKSANIEFYSSIVFQVDITAYHQEPVDYCEIWYNFDNIVYTKYSAWNYGIYKNVKINFPQSTTAKRIYIRLQVIGNHTSCYWDNTMLRGISVNNSNITTDAESFSSMYSIYSILLLILEFVIVCCIVIVIIRLICKRIKNRKDSIESIEAINIQNLERAIMEIMSSLQLSQYDINFYKLSKYSNTITSTPSDQMIIPLKKDNYTETNNENTLTNTVSTANTIHQIYCSSSDDIPLERPNYHNYSIDTITPKSSNKQTTLTNGHQFAQINAAKSDTYDGTYSLSLSKLECFLNDLEMEIVQEQNICDTTNDSISDTIIKHRTMTETNCDSASMYVNKSTKYSDTFL
eukprot:60531_1